MKIELLALCLLASVSAAFSQSTPYQLGVAAMDKNDLKTAITSFDQAVTNDAKDYKSYLKRGECLYQLGDYRLAIDDFNQCTSANAKNADALLWRANCNAKLGQNDAALKDYKAALVVDPTRIAVLSQRATFSAQRQQPSLQEEEGTSSAASTAAPSAPTESPALVAPPVVTALHLTPNLFNREKNPDQELSELGSAISLDPKNPQLFYGRAKAFIQLKKYDSAVNDLNDAIMNNPNNASYYLARAFVYHEQKNDILADEDIRQAQFCDPGLPKTIDFATPSSDQHK